MINQIKKHTLALALLSISIFTPAVSLHAQDNFTIFHSSNLNGEIVPCGSWGENKLGGLSRKASLLKALRSSTPLNLYVDAGNSLFKRKTAISTQSVDAASLILRIYDKIGVDIFCPGPNDLIGGLKLFNSFTPKNLTIISSNLYSSSSDKPVFKTFKQIQLGNFSIGILGLSGTEVKKPSEYYFKDTTTVLENLITRYQDTTDYFILLSSMSLDENKAIAHAFHNISIIVSADNRITSISPLIHDKTLIVQTVSRGKHFGAINVLPGASSAWGEDYRSLIKSKTRSLLSFENRLKIKQQQPTDHSNEDVVILQDRINTVQTELAALQKLKEENDIDFSHYETRSYKLDRTVMNDEQIEEILDSSLPTGKK